VSAYKKANLDEIAAKQWPHWIPVRHFFGIDAFGVNAYRAKAGATAVPEHDETASGHVELFYVATGNATFTVDGEQFEAPAGTFVYIADAAAKRGAQATIDDTVVVAMGSLRGKPYEVLGWDTQYLEGDE
jgi:uncharacterized cupin superfamily protein